MSGGPTDAYFWLGVAVIALPVLILCWGASR